MDSPALKRKRPSYNYCYGKLTDAARACMKIGYCDVRDVAKQVNCAESTVRHWFRKVGYQHHLWAFEKRNSDDGARRWGTFMRSKARRSPRRRARKSRFLGAAQ